MPKNVLHVVPTNLHIFFFKYFFLISDLLLLKNLIAHFLCLCKRRTREDKKKYKKNLPTFIPKKYYICVCLTKSLARLKQINDIVFEMDFFFVLFDEQKQ